MYVEDAWRVPGIAAVAEGFAGPPEHQYIDWGDEPFDLRQYVKMGLWAQPGTNKAVLVVTSACVASPVALDLSIITTVDTIEGPVDQDSRQQAQTQHSWAPNERTTPRDSTAVPGRCMTPIKAPAQRSYNTIQQCSSLQLEKLMD